MPDGGFATSTRPIVNNCVLRPLTPRSSRPDQQALTTTRAAVILGLDGDSIDAVEHLRQSCIHHLTDGQDNGDSLPHPIDAAESPRGRYGIVASGNSNTELVENLRSAKVVGVPERPRKVIFLFAGQGGQYVGMGAALYHTVPTFRQAVDQCQALLTSWGFTGMLPFILGSTGSATIEAEHTAMFTLEYGLARMWTTWGVRPDVVLGQSLGEYPALVWSGVLSLEDGLWLVWKRAKLASERCARNSSGMLLILARLDAIEDTIQKYDRLSMVCYNSDDNGIVGGDKEQLNLLAGECQQKGWWHRTITIPYAFHTSCMEPIVDALCDVGRSVAISCPSIPVVSAVRGLVVEAGDPSVFSDEYFAHHALRPVLLHDSINALAARNPELASNGVWLEIGPHATVLPLLKMHKAVSEECLLVSSLRRGDLDEESIRQALVCLYRNGVGADPGDDLERLKVHVVTVRSGAVARDDIRAAT